MTELSWMACQKAKTMPAWAMPAYSCIGIERLSCLDCLDKSGNLNPDILELLLKFRLHKFGLSAYIPKAFPKIGIQERDRDVCRFFWYSRVLTGSP